LWTIAQREFLAIFTERTILLAVVIQIIVAGFSSFLVVGLSALVDPSSFPTDVRAEIALDPEASDDATLVRHLRAAGLAVTHTSDSNETLALFQDGFVNAALFLDPPDPDNPDAAELPIGMTLILPDADIRTTLTLVQVKEALEGYERDLRDERAQRLSFSPLYLNTDADGGSFGFVYSLLIPLLVFLPVVLAGALCADSLTEEVQRKTLPLLLASPATPADVVEGKLLANSAIAPLLAAAWFLLLAINDLPVSASAALEILAFATAIAYLMGLLASAIALATRDRNKAHVTYASAMFLLLGLSLALPVSPVNAVALLAAGSATAGAHTVVIVTVGLAIASAGGLRIALRRTTQWMAAGGV